jgi:hypothetical protein
MREYIATFVNPETGHRDHFQFWADDIQLAKDHADHLTTAAMEFIGLRVAKVERVYH